MKRTRSSSMPREKTRAYGADQAHRVSITPALSPHDMLKRPVRSRSKVLATHAPPRPVSRERIHLPKCACRDSFSLLLRTFLRRAVLTTTPTSPTPIAVDLAELGN